MSSSTSGLSRRRSASRSPQHTHHALPRPRAPSNPPEPPLTLLHPVESRRPPRDLPPGDSTPTLTGGQVRTSEGPAPTESRRRWTVSRLFRSFGSGMRRDIAARAPYYISDWTDAWNYRVIPATLFIFFANILPGIAFSLDLIETTGQYGVQEVLLSSFMAAFVASVFGGQPLLISGVTGPITVYNKTIYDIFQGKKDFDYLAFVGWAYLWAAILHWVAAALNAVRGLKYVTRFACDTFGFYVSAVYVQYGIQVVTRQFGQSSVTAGFLGIILAVITLVLPHYFNAVAGSGYGNRHVRRFCADYGMPITIIAVSGLAYWGRFDQYVLEANMTLPTTPHSFQAVNGRPWLVRFWELPAHYVGIAFPFGLVLFILFYFDANVSSLIAQGSEFPLRKPSAFHYDTFLLGITTFIAGLLGIPAPNGLIPQAPLHTASLVIMGYEDASESAKSTEKTSRTTPPDDSAIVDDDALQMSQMENGSSPESHLRLRQTTSRMENLRRTLSVSKEARAERRRMSESRRQLREVPIGVVEQRVSNLAQGALCLVLMTRPFEHVLGLIPKGVLAGLFWFMGSDALLSSGVTQKILFLIRDRRATSPDDPLLDVRTSRVILFTLIELLGFGATFAITQTIAAIGFPVIITLLVPLRVWVVPYLGFTKEELDILDGPVASPFTLESVGGSL